MTAAQGQSCSCTVTQDARAFKAFASPQTPVSATTEQSSQQYRHILLPRFSSCALISLCLSYPVVYVCVCVCVLGCVWVCMPGGRGVQHCAHAPSGSFMASPPWCPPLPHIRADTLRHTPLHTHTHTHTETHTHIPRAHSHVHTNEHTCIYKNTHAHIYTYLCMNVYTYTSTYSYTHARARAHTLSDTHTRSNASLQSCTRGGYGSIFSSGTKAEEGRDSGHGFTPERR